MPTRRDITALLAASLMIPGQGFSQSVDLYQLQRNLINGTPAEFFAALETIKQRGLPDMAAGLIASMRFTNGPNSNISKALSAITGEKDAQSWFDWMLWQERNPQVIPDPSFIKFKREIFLAIDPNFKIFLDPQDIQPDAMRIRLEEITWGGVRKDGIPSLDAPDLIRADEADYLQSDDLVFGVEINGDARAYPLRIMGWHEMFNDVIGGVPVALAYCTLCGSGILFETKLASEHDPLIFGSSGFLYRSNKLMFDRTTHSLWNQFTGEPVSGPMTRQKHVLVQRPIVIDTWTSWHAANPTTRVLSLNTGFDRDYGSGVVYDDYFTSNYLMFPVDVDQGKVAQKDFVFGIRQFGGAKAWPLDAFRNTPLINDEILGRQIVLIGDAETRTVRAFERGTRRFEVGLTSLTSDDDLDWSITETALISSEGQKLPRVAGHIAYWFAWNSYLAANSELYEH